MFFNMEAMRRHHGELSSAPRDHLATEQNRYYLKYAYMDIEMVARCGPRRDSCLSKA